MIDPVSCKYRRRGGGRRRRGDGRWKGALGLALLHRLVAGPVARATVAVVFLRVAAWDQAALVAPGLGRYA